MNLDVFTHRLSELYQPPSGEFTFVDVPELKYIMVDGAGAPAGVEFQAAVKRVFSVAHFIKPHIRKKLGQRFVEPPLECLFWSDRPVPLTEVDRVDWRWRVMIVVLEYVTEEIFQEAALKAAARLGPFDASLHLGYTREGRCVQTTHLGDYAGVEEMCRSLYRDLLPQWGVAPCGPYHEIYLNDPTRVAPEKRRMVVRQPVA